jgi:hypothetical protein
MPTRDLADRVGRDALLRLPTTGGEAVVLADAVMRGDTTRIDALPLPV